MLVDEPSMPLLMRRPSKPRGPQARSGLAQNLTQLRADALILVGARRLDQQPDLTRGVGDGPSMHRLPLLVGRGDDLLTQRVEQTCQVATGLPACHSSLQFR